MEKTKYTSVLILLLLALILAGCGASDGTTLIGSYPTDALGSTRLDSLPSNAVVVYHAQIDLAVDSIPKAINDLFELTGKYGGYTTYAYSWYQDTQEHATVILSVPTFNYDRLYDRITHLGKVKDETIIGELSSARHHEGSTLEMSTITINLTEKDSLSFSSPNRWRPLNTLGDALAVASTIFRFLFDVLIWILIVAGPFVLIGFGINQTAMRWKITITKKK